MTNEYPYISRRRYSQSDGINDESTYVVRNEGIGKASSDVSPYLIANEWICGKIAQFLQLPIPSFSIIRKKSRSTRMFVTHRFELDTSPARFNPAILYTALPHRCTGVVVFDIFVCNCDRAVRNIKVDSSSRPRVMHIIDHERALFYVYPKVGKMRLERNENRLGISDMHGSDETSHCLIEYLDSYDYLREWVHRVQTIPDWFIDCICQDVWKKQITRIELRAVQSFLKSRRDKLWKLICDNRDRFAKINNPQWDLFA